MTLLDCNVKFREQVMSHAMKHRFLKTDFGETKFENTFLSRIYNEAKRRVKQTPANHLKKHKKKLDSVLEYNSKQRAAAAMADMLKFENLDSANVHEGKLLAVTIDPNTEGTKISNTSVPSSNPSDNVVYNNSQIDCSMENSIMNQTTKTSEKETTEENAGELKLGHGRPATKSTEPVDIAEKLEFVSSINTDGGRTVILSDHHCKPGNTINDCKEEGNDKKKHFDISSA